MPKQYELVFDDVMIKQLKKAAKNHQIKALLTKMLDKLESLGPDAGKLLDTKLSMYEIKNKHPPIRLYYKNLEHTKKILVFEYEMKKSEKSQGKTITKLRQKSSEA